MSGHATGADARFARLVVDTGLHARRWSRDDARAYLAVLEELVEAWIARRLACR
jgi:uncharacterized protein (DUF885 family)